MGSFKIPLEWVCYGELDIETESLDEVVDEVNLNSDEVILPQEWELKEGSVKVRFEKIEELNPGYKLKKELQRKELKAKDFGIVDKESQEVEEICDDEERESRRHLSAIGEGYQEDSEEEGDEEEG